MQVNAELRWLCAVPGVEPVIVGAIIAFAPDLRTFASGRNFAAWFGLVPRQRSMGGKARLGSMSKMGKSDPQAPRRRRDEQNPVDHAKRRTPG